MALAALSGSREYHHGRQLELYRFAYLHIYIPCKCAGFILHLTTRHTMNDNVTITETVTSWRAASMYKPRTSYKQACEAAALLGGTFYGSHEYQPVNKKCCVRLDGIDHEFNTYTAALEWMLEEAYRRDFGEGA